jgi:hypothetical protein
VSLAEVVGCAPFRLSAPRALTPYEWAVVETALGRAMSQKAFGLGTSGEPRQLVLAMQMQQCPAWKTSLFGPPPSVATYWYKCFATWYAGFDPMTRAKIRADIGGGLLCSSNGAPWANCTPESRGAGPADLWEGGPQIVEPAMGYPSNEGCALLRDRTMYTPVRGKDLVKMLQFLGPAGQLPPGLLQMAQAAPALFLDKDFLLGVQAKKDISAAVLGGGLAPDLPGLALQTLEEVALIWAPGQGASLLDFFSGKIDAAKLMALLTKMSPDMLGTLASSLPGILQTLPGLAAQYGPAMGDIFGAATQMIPQLLTGLQGLAGASSQGASQPGTRPTTGLSVIDQQGSQLAGREPPPLPPGTPTVSLSTGDKTSLLWMAAAAVVALGLVVIVAKASD